MFLSCLVSVHKTFHSTVLIPLASAVTMVEVFFGGKGGAYDLPLPLSLASPASELLENLNKTDKFGLVFYPGKGYKCRGR